MCFSIRELHLNGGLFRDSFVALSNSQGPPNPSYGDGADSRRHDELQMKRDLSPQSSQAVVPRVIFFGGDVVSLASLKALHARMRCIFGHTTHSSSLQEGVVGGNHDELVEALVRDHLTVVCPSLPSGLTPRQVIDTYTRQYPIARYAAAEGLHVIPVDHPHSFAKSLLLQEMLEGASDFAKDDHASAASTLLASASLQDRLPTSTAGETVCRPEHAPSPEIDGSPPPPWTWRAAGRPLRDFDLAVVVSFRYFLPERLLRRLPCTINMHPSLLPRYRGASPVFSTLMRNEAEGGVSVIRLPPGKAAMDSGDILWQRRLPIPREMDIRGYLPLVVELGAAGLCEVIFGAPDSTLASSPSPTFVTSEVIQDALETVQRLEMKRGDAPPSRRHPPVPREGEVAAATEAAAAGAFSRSVHHAFSDWPGGFFSRLAAAVPQTYASYSHFSMDPFHAPLLPRNAAGLKFSLASGTDLFGVWRAFVGGRYFHPCVNATLDTGRSPVAERLRQCALRRLTRGKPARHEGARRSVMTPHCGDGPPPSDGEPSGKGAARDGPNQGGGGAEESCGETMMDRAVKDLRLSCTFTMALHPHLVPSGVLEELSAMEAGDHLCFYQPPPPLGSQQGSYGASVDYFSIRGSRDDKAEQFVEVGRQTTDTLLSVAWSDKNRPNDNEGDKSCPGCTSEPHAQQHCIPPGTGYFPKCAEEIGAIKCRHGWFFWKQAHLKCAPRPQPVNLLRKGLGMKTGVLYVGLFSEYS
ncbi:unnamed protein product [Phytomonas sp. EM1]|nr:unnamed protein product [Phytomonas sp. EM1]|eukprot:CCW60414.1 unnamed protein product [Phytomonas sp. isolate EM1]